MQVCFTKIKQTRPTKVELGPAAGGSFMTKNSRLLRTTQYNWPSVGLMTLVARVTRNREEQR